MAKLFVDEGLIVISAFIFPFRAEREIAKALLEDGEFVEVYMSMPLDVCEGRDSKGLYRKERQGGIRKNTGVDSKYEVPLSPSLVINIEILQLNCV